jgi:hypothetical protein
LYYVFLNRYKNDNRFYKVAIQTFFDSDFDQSIYWDATDEPMTKKEEQLFKMVLPEDANFLVYHLGVQLVAEEPGSFYVLFYGLFYLLGYLGHVKGVHYY